MAFNRSIQLPFRFEIKRFYARGTRLIPSISNNARNTKNQSEQPTTQPKDSESHIEVTNKSVEELLNNATTGDAISSHQRPKRIEDVWDSAPYPKNSNPKQSQAKFSSRPSRNPRETSVILFPGQGETCPYLAGKPLSNIICQND